MLDIMLRRNRDIDSRLIELRIISSGITVYILSGICIERTDFCVTNIVLASYIARVDIRIWNIYFKSCYLDWRSSCFDMKFICEKEIFKSLIYFGRSDICIWDSCYFSRKLSPMEKILNNLDNFNFERKEKNTFVSWI